MPRILKNLLEDIEFKCSDKECSRDNKNKKRERKKQEIYRYLDYYQHLKSHNTNNIMKCPNQCGSILSYGYLVDHLKDKREEKGVIGHLDDLNTCLNLKVKCKDCNFLVHYHGIYRHECLLKRMGQKFDDILFNSVMTINSLQARLKELQISDVEMSK